MKKMLDGLVWHKLYATQIGCLVGAFNYLGYDHSLAWIHGGTAAAFSINLAPGLTINSPTAWDDTVLHHLALNLGAHVMGVSIDKPFAGESYPHYQREAWDLAREGIDQDMPVYAWEVQPQLPDFSLIHGYEDGQGDLPAGYYFTGWETGGPTPWNELGDGNSQEIRLYRVESREPAPPIQVLKDTLNEVVSRLDKEDSGLSCSPTYNTWSDQLEKGQAVSDSHRYNTATWHEARTQAVDFLQEASDYTPIRSKPRLDEAVRWLTQMRDTLKTATDLHPILDEWDERALIQSDEAASLIRAAGEAELKALDSLAEVVTTL